MLDYAADDRQIPEELIKGPAEHDPCRITETAKLKQIEELGNAGLRVTVAFHEKALLPDQKKITDEYLVQKGEEQPGGCKKQPYPGGMKEKSIDCF